MRIILILPVLLLGACQVSKDDANNTVSVTLNEDVAANTAADVGNTAKCRLATSATRPNRPGTRFRTRSTTHDLDTTTTTTTTRPTRTRRHPCPLRSDAAASISRPDVPRTSGRR